MYNFSRYTMPVDAYIDIFLISILSVILLEIWKKTLTIHHLQESRQGRTLLTCFFWLSHIVA